MHKRDGASHSLQWTRLCYNQRRMNQGYAMSPAREMVRVFIDDLASAGRQMTGARQKKCNPETLHSKSVRLPFVLRGGRLRMIVA